MLSFFFIQLLVLSAYARYSIFNEVIKDPVSFAQTFSQVNPAQVKEIIHIIEGLISDGQTKKSDIINAHEKAVSVLKGATKDLGDALWAYETARGERLEADIEVAKLENVLATKQDEERAAADAKDFATAERDAAQEFMNSEVARVNAEKAIFEQVIDILKNLPKSLIEGSDSFRNQNIPSNLAPIVPALIQAARANPGAVSKVITLVEELIAAGEQIRADVTAARDGQQQVLDDATQKHSDAVEATVAAEDDLKAAEDVAAQKLATEKTLEKIWEDATAVHDAAEKDEAAKRAIREREVPILDSEDESLHKVLEILEGLL